MADTLLKVISEFIEHFLRRSIAESVHAGGPLVKHRKFVLRKVYESTGVQTRDHLL